MLPLKDNIPLARLPLVTIALVAVNALGYLLAIRHGGSFLDGPTRSVAVHYGAVPHELTHPAGHDPPTWETVFTSLFVHGGFLHVVVNMAFLAIFGPTVESAVGRLRFALLYLLGGLVTIGVQVLADPGSTAPALGSSGAVAAVLGGYILLHPRGRILSLVLIPFFVTIVEVPAVLLIGFWAVEQLYVELAGLASPVTGGEGIAYLAQIGGFAFGLLAIRLLAGPRGSRLGPMAPPVGTLR